MIYDKDKLFECVYGLFVCASFKSMANVEHYRGATTSLEIYYRYCDLYRQPPKKGVIRLINSIVDSDIFEPYT